MAGRWSEPSRAGRQGVSFEGEIVLWVVRWYCRSGISYRDLEQMVMRALRKGQASSFNIIRDMRGEARLVERAFNVGPCVLAGAMQLISQQLELQDA